MQPATVAVTVIVPDIAVLPGLAAVNTGVLPVPLAGKPILGLLLVQVKVPPAGVVVKLLAGTLAPVGGGEAENIGTDADCSITMSANPRILKVHLQQKDNNKVELTVVGLKD